VKTQKGKTLGLLAGLLSLFSRRPKPDNLSKHDLGSNTQKIGLSFTEKIRDNFRSRWLKKR
jgi:hypothetical protein